MLLGESIPIMHPVSPIKQPIFYWVTNADQSLLLSKQRANLFSGIIPNTDPVIEIDETIRYQKVEGFGFTLTGGSASLIHQLGVTKKNALLNELFGHQINSIGTSYLRISIGASDLSNEVFSYNDLPIGETDTALKCFSLSRDTVELIPILKKVIQINPGIKIMGSPWSAPSWMKSNQLSKGGYLLPQYYAIYAKYLLKYIQEMHTCGIELDAITIQNEPENGANNPSMMMTALEQANFIKNHLGPLFKRAGVQTKIIIYDHNCDHPNYPISILNDSVARQYIDGSAFHLYLGDINALSTVHNQYPNKAIYFTEQWTSKNGVFGNDLQWHVKNVLIGSMRNYSVTALEWNLANDPNFKPYTPGGCSECKGALTIQNDSIISRNVSYYIIAHAAKFIPVGSVRIESNDADGLYSVAFITPNKKKVLIVLNQALQKKYFNIRLKKAWIHTALSAGAVATFII